MRMLTQRLELVSFTDDELEAVALGEREGRLWAPDYPTMGDVLLAGIARIAGVAIPTDAQPWGPLQIRERSGLALGGAGFKGPPDDGCGEIGYGLAPSARGRGYATEAVQALVAVGVTQGLDAVTAETHAGNSSSERVLLRAGFEVIGVSAEMTLWRLELA